MFIFITPEMMTEKSFWPNFAGTRGVVEEEGASGGLLDGTLVGSCFRAILVIVGDNTK